MTNVVRLVRAVSDDTVAVLRCLLARAETGDVTGLAMCFRDRHGNENSAFSGLYKARPAEGVNAALRLSWRLTQVQDELTGPP